ncbi:MAG: DnaB-like helicase N-terminal domain-containing protein [Rivularia sp. (in: cyanobacteria)]
MNNIEFASYIDKLPPACIEAEEAILGGILMDTNAFSVVDSIIHVEAFYIKAHQSIYRAAKSLYKEQRPINLLTVIDYLKTKGKLLDVGGQNKLASLVDRVVSNVNIDALAKLVNEKFLRRQLIELGHEIANRGSDQLIDTRDFLLRAKNRFEETVSLGLVESEQDKISREYDSLIQKINDIELTENNPGKKHLRLLRLARNSGYSLRELENLYRKSLADFSTTVLKSMSDLLNECGDDDRKWLMHGFIPEATTILLHAQGGVGKTKFAYELAYNLIEGKDWGGYPVTQKCKVLCYQTDESPQDMKHALTARGFKAGEDFMYRDNWVVDAIPQLIADVKELRPQFIIIDSLTTVSRHSVFSENDTEYARPLLQMVQIAKEYGCTIMVIHHSNADDRSRGTRAIFNSVSEVWSFKEDKAESASNLEKLLHIEKSRSRAPMIYRLRFDPDDYSWHCLQREGGDSTDLNNKDKILKFLCDNRNIAYEVDEIANQIGLARSTAARVLNYLKAEGAISRKDRGQKNKPYCYYVRTNASHTPPKKGCTDEKNYFPSTTGNTENASQCNKMLLTTDEKNETGITTGNTENASHPTAFFSENNLEKKSKKSEEGEKHSANPGQDKENILLTPPSQNASHPEKNSEPLRLKVEEGEDSLNNSQQGKQVNSCKQDAISSDFSEVMSIERLGKFGVTKAEFLVKNSTRKRTRKECRVYFTFPNESSLSAKFHFKSLDRESLEKCLSHRVEVWEKKFMVNPENKWDVRVLKGSEENPEYEWVKGCTMAKIATPPTDRWYTFNSPLGETLRVVGEDEFKLSES